MKSAFISLPSIKHDEVELVCKPGITALTIGQCRRVLENVYEA